MNLSDITPLLLTFNEALNIQQSLSALAWAKQVVVVDSHSDDATIELAKSFPNVRVISRDFDNHTNQWNFGLDQIATDWVLTLDADYVCDSQLHLELSRLAQSHSLYFARFRYCVFGKPLRACLYPNRAVLFKAREFRYLPDGHTQLLDTQNAPSGLLHSVIRHDDRKPLSRWYASQLKYANLEVEKLNAVPAANLGWKDKMRKQIFLVPPLVFVYCLIAKRLLLDGRAGWFYSLQRLLAELLLSLLLLERKLRRD